MYGGKIVTAIPAPNPQIAHLQLRGLGDTRTPMLCHFTAYWIIGLPLGAWLCFRLRWGAFGLWAGLSLALILIGIVLLLVWQWRVRNLPNSIAEGVYPANSPTGQF